MDQHNGMTATGHVGDDGVLEGLSRFATLPDWLSDVMDPGRLRSALSAGVPEIARGELEIVECQTERLRAKEVDWQVRCRVTVAPAGRPEAARTVVLTGTLAEQGHGEQPGPDVTDGAGRGDVAFGEPGWRGRLDRLGLRLQVEQADPGLPVLPALVDPTAARRLLQSCLRAGEYPHAVVRSCEPNIVRYKPGSRCTIVYRMGYGSARGAQEGAGPDPLVVKTHQGDKGYTAFEAMTALWATSLARGDVVTLAEPIAYMAAERVLVQGPVPEDRTLKELAREAFTDGGRDAIDRLRGALGDTAVALAALHRSGARYGRVATWEEEVAEIREVVGRLARGVPELATASEPLLRRLERTAADVPADPPVSAHHDFRPAQVLLHAGRVGFIDFDGACMVEPGLDLGRFRAKLRDIAVSVPDQAGNWPIGDALERRLRLLDELCDGFLDNYRQEAAVTSDRVVLWETVDLLTTLLHAWTKVRTLRVAPRLAALEHQVRVTGLARETLTLA
jgi:hypothetical protein